MTEPRIHPRGSNERHKQRALQTEINAALDERSRSRTALGRAVSAIDNDIGRVNVLDMGELSRQVIEQLDGLKKQAGENVAGCERKIDRLKSPYVISHELQQAYDLAVFTDQPLLVEGEPGTGKTSLAYAIAAENGMPIIHCRGKSTQTAQSVMYEIDYVGRLNDAMLTQNIPDVLREQTKQWTTYLKEGGDSNATDFKTFMTGFEQSAKLLNLGKVSDIRNYIKYGELGEAIVRSAQGEMIVLLFDEIDKAKTEFPNDLLDELEHQTIRIRETGEEISAPKGNIIVIITSNRERDLPPAFRRRCVYNFIDFPPPEQMREIVMAHIPDISTRYTRLLETALQRFYEIRSSSNLKKMPTTSEMISWVKALIHYGVKEVTQSTPYAGLLLKHEEDLKQFSESQSLEDNLRRQGVPAAMLAALRGERVIRLSTFYDEANPRDHVLATLANHNIPFTTAREKKPFAIALQGINNLGQCTISLPADVSNRSDLEKLFSILEKEKCIDSMIIVTRDPKTFAKIKIATTDFVYGVDKDEKPLLKDIRRGFWVYSKPFTNK